MPNLDYEADRHCPVFNRTIDCDLCYESIMALSRFVKISSVPELNEIKDIEKARVTCDKCPYSDLG
ncbi:MAG: hypothetical protein ACI4J2_01470 [Ruminococcus sp.]